MQSRQSDLHHEVNTAAQAMALFSVLSNALSELPVSIWLAAAATFAVYHAIRAVYLIFFSPLAIFPGSPWAALGE